MSGSRMYGPDGSQLWEFEVHTWSTVSDNGRYMEEHPTGMLSFRCSCGHRIFDRAPETVRLARDHVRTDHPDWEQIPDDEPTPEQEAWMIAMIEQHMSGEPVTYPPGVIGHEATAQRVGMGVACTFTARLANGSTVTKKWTVGCG